MSKTRRKKSHTRAGEKETETETSMTTNREKKCWMRMK
jgi:hypothetical protein